MLYLSQLLLILSLFIAPASKSIYDFPIKDINGKKIDLSEYKGKKLLLVNTASKCGYTPQYADLDKLARQYGDKVVVIGFPANNFGGQEPGTNAEIKTFCSKNYDISFQLSQKISVDGSDIDPLFKWLCNQRNPDFVGKINWNFEKFLIDENGKLIRRFRSKVNPLDQEIIKSL